MILVILFVPGHDALLLVTLHLFSIFSGIIMATT